MALWFPLSWESVPNVSGTKINVDFGVLQPVRATWESSENGFWLAFTELRLGAWILSIVLTAAAILAARQAYRQLQVVRCLGPDAPPIQTG